MCPFLGEEDGDDFEDYQIDNGQNLKSSENDNFRSKLLRDDKKFFIIGGMTSIVAFCVVIYVMYSNNKPIDLEDLPVIRADTTPIKIKPTSNLQVDHQDKVVYDNIADVKRMSVNDRTISQPEEVLSINETDPDGVLSEEDKKNIIQAFDDLAPEKEYKINYVKSDKNSGATQRESGRSHRAILKIVEDERPPIKRIGPDDNPRNRLVSSSKKGKEKNLTASNKLTSAKPAETNDEFTPARGGNVMIQVASVPTKSAAEAEYKRIVSRNKMLRGAGKKIVKIDLGKSKGITYRIQVGPFKNNSEASKVVSSLKNNGFSSYISR